MAKDDPRKKRNAPELPEDFAIPNELGCCGKCIPGVDTCVYELRSEEE